MLLFYSHPLPITLGRWCSQTVGFRAGATLPKEASSFLRKPSPPGAPSRWCHQPLQLHTGTTTTTREAYTLPHDKHAVPGALPSRLA
jgi:hypothetical protein